MITRSQEIGNSMTSPFSEMMIIISHQLRTLVNYYDLRETQSISELPRGFSEHLRVLLQHLRLSQSVSDGFSSSQSL